MPISLQMFIFNFPKIYSYALPQRSTLVIKLSAFLYHQFKFLLDYPRFYSFFTQFPFPKSDFIQCIILFMISSFYCLVSIKFFHLQLLYSRVTPKEDICYFNWSFTSLHSKKKTVFFVIFIISKPFDNHFFNKFPTKNTLLSSLTNELLRYLVSKQSQTKQILFFVVSSASVPYLKFEISIATLLLIRPN